MDAGQAERRDELYRKASASPLMDAAFQLWREHDWLNTMEQVRDGPQFPPLPLGAHIMAVMPEALRRYDLTNAHEKAALENGPTMLRLARCRPESTLDERLAALRAAIRLVEDLPKLQFKLYREKAASDAFAALRMALEIVKAENPGFLQASYDQAYLDNHMGLI